RLGGRLALPKPNREVVVNHFLSCIRVPPALPVQFPATRAEVTREHTSVWPTPAIASSTPVWPGKSLPNRRGLVPHFAFCYYPPPAFAANEPGTTATVDAAHHGLYVASCAPGAHQPLALPIMDARDVMRFWMRLIL
ncbi:MAG: hypothetical protein O3C40_23585, partial [Planctomycetota bacterium]|nr:hypothetical protein [Planctomycetota bacterium]